MPQSRRLSLSKTPSGAIRQNLARRIGKAGVLLSPDLFFGRRSSMHSREDPSESGALEYQAVWPERATASVAFASQYAQGIALPFRVYSNPARNNDVLPTPDWPRTTI